MASASGRRANGPGAKALIVVAFTARLKPCPDTKHEFFRSVKPDVFPSIHGPAKRLRKSLDFPVGAFSPGLKPN
jgi:hypothetical protein